MNRSAIALAAFALGLALVAPLQAQQRASIPPPPEHFVTDRAGFLKEPTRAALDARLNAFQRDTGHQVIVYIDRSTGGVPIEDWAVRAFAAWRVGRRQADDGLALFVFSDDRHVRIEVGYGLESVITDAFASRVIRETILPRVQAGDADGAITGAVDRLVGAIQRGGPEAGAPPPTGGPQTAPWQRIGLARGLLYGVLAVIMVLVAIRYPWLAWMILRGFGRGGGGGPGGGGGFSGGGGRSGGGGASGGW